MKKLILFLLMILSLQAFCQVRQMKRTTDNSPAIQNNQAPPVGNNTVARILTPVSMLNNATAFLILGQQKFEQTIQRLVDHKNKSVTATAFISIESLYSYAGDEPEKIKRAIAEAYITKGVRYVMLVGDASCFPVRHRYVSNGWEYGRTGSEEYQWFEGSYNPTDLYYSNLFHHDENGGIGDKPVFSSWDEDKDGFYNKQIWQFPGAEKAGINSITINPDNVDGYPDVSLSRLPVHSVQELSSFIDKIIKYDDGNMIPESKSGLAFLASANYPGATGLDQEIINYISPTYISRSNIQQFAFGYGNNVPAGWDEGTFASVKNAAVSNWGIIYMGHASSSSWDLSEGGRPFDDSVINTFRNALSLPVIFTIGCSSGRFKPNIPDCVPYPAGPYYDINGKEAYYTRSDGNKYYQMGTFQELPRPFRLPQPSPYDLPSAYARTFASPWLCHPYQGGAIAFFGETVVCENMHGTDLIKRVLRSYASPNRFLGDAWVQGQRQYWRDFRTDPGVFHNPRIYLSIMTFFGDPTLVLPVGGQ
jgi:Peptidase family C25